MSTRPPSKGPPSGGSPFDVPPTPPDAMDTGMFRLGPFEQQYEQLVSEALEHGLISEQDRERLDLAAKALGLDTERAGRLELALRAANAAHARDTLVDADENEDPSTISFRRRPRDSLPSLADTSDISEPRAEPATLPDLGLADRIDVDALHERYEVLGQSGEIDAQFCTASVLAHVGAATTAQRRLFERNRASTPARPKRALGTESWQLLFHPVQDRLVGEIFAVIASAALIGRVSAMRADQTLPYLDPTQRQDPGASTISSVRALAWAASTLGMHPPPIFVAPELDTALEVVTAVPPATRVGARMLTGRGSLALAFHCARHLTWYREEHFVCTLVPTINDLSDLFVAALSIGAPNLDLRDDVRERTSLIAEAILPVLEPVPLHRLRELVARFVSLGGRTSLHDWTLAAGWTACRAGLLLCGDLEVACDIVAGETGGAERVRELQHFWASDQAAELRKLLGVAIGY